MSNKVKTTKMNQSKQELVPKLRFSEFKNDGEWEEKVVGDVGKVSMCKRILKDQTTTNGDVPFFKIGTFGKKADAYISEKIYDNFKSKYSFPKIGDVLISASGTIGRTVVYDGLPAYFQDSNIVWIDNNEELVSNRFLLCCYKKIKWNTEDTTIARLYNENLRSTPIILPSKKEQQKIADCLSSIDDLITAESEKLESIKNHKKGLMQNLFPSEGKTIPNFRFPEFKNDGKWEVKPLESCLDYLQPTVYLVSNTNYSDDYETPVLTAGKTFLLGYTNEKHGIFKNTLPVIIFDDFTTATQFVDFPFKAKSSAMKILQAKDGANIKFMYEAMQVISYEVGNHERHWISKFAPMCIPIPRQPEQQKIADCLSSIDDLITSQTQKIDALKKHKKGLMQQLFPNVSEAQNFNIKQ